MMPFESWLMVVGIVVAGAVYRAYLYRNRAGRLRQVEYPADPGAAAFETDFGTFVICPSRNELLCSLATGVSRRIPFLSIERFEVEKKQASALIQEILLGLDPADLDPQFKDTIDFEIVTLGLDDGRSVPVFGVGELHHREVGTADWIFDVEKLVLALLGLYEPAHRRTQTAFNFIRGTLWPLVSVSREDHLGYDRPAERYRSDL